MDPSAAEWTIFKCEMERLSTTCRKPLRFDHLHHALVHCEFHNKGTLSKEMKEELLRLKNKVRGLARKSS